jgi:two-component sensor histidine kinase
MSQESDGTAKAAEPMIETILTTLRERRGDLTAQALSRLAEHTEWSTGDLWRLLDLCDEASYAGALDASESEGRLLAQRGERLDVRLESIERTADALGGAIDSIFAASEDQCLIAREALRAARRMAITSMAHGFQGAAESATQAERERVQLAHNRLRALQRLNATINSGQDFDETLASAARILSEELGVDLCAIFLYDVMTNELTLHSTNRSPDDLAGHYTIHLGEWLTGEIAQRGTPGGITDVSSLTARPVEAHLFDRRYRALFVVPIIFFSSDGTLLEGAITLLSERPREFSADEIGFLELAAGQLAISIENSHIYHRTDELVRRQIASISTLQRISATVATSFDLVRVLQMIINQAIQLSAASRGAVFQFDHDNSLQMVVHHGLEAPGMRDVRVQFGECCVGRCAERSDRVWGLDCMHTDPTCVLRQLHLSLPEVHSALAVPLTSRGTLQGVLFLLSDSSRVQPGMQARMVETFANEAAVAIESSNLYEETLRALEIKSHLLQEMHHRVKNNLLSIAAILRMERRRTTAPETARVLSESISRIDGMAATHDLLSREERIGTASIADLAAKLVGVVSAHLVPPTLHVDFDIRPSAVEVQSRRALALALVLNEVLANAIEHGFESRDHGRIVIGAWEHDEHVTLIVADDGVPPPTDLDLSQLSSLGLPLVRDMTRDQLHGTFRLAYASLPELLRDDPADETPWTMAEFTFPAERDPMASSQA